MGQQSQESASLWYYATLNSVSFFLFHSSPHTHIHSWLGNEYISHIIILLSPSLSLLHTHTARSSKPIHHFPSRVCLLSSSVRRRFMKHQHSPDRSPLPEHRVQTMSSLWVLGCIYLSFHFMSKPQPHLTLNLMWSLIIAQVFLKFSPCGVAFRSSVC